MKIGVAAGGVFAGITLSLSLSLSFSLQAQPVSPAVRTSFDEGWRFTKGDPAGLESKLAYSEIKDWVEASGTRFTTNADLAGKTKPDGDPAENVSYTLDNFDDSSWRLLNLPHDWGIEGPFKQEYPGETGKLPWWGVGWYRKHLTVPASDQGKSIFLDVDGAMSYATVWLNGHFVGGWPYGYASWRVDLTPGIQFGKDNIVAIRLDNPMNSSRWYPGGGIYRNVWLVKTAPIHVAQWGTYVTTPQIGTDSATVDVHVTLDNDSDTRGVATVRNEIFELDADGSRGKSVAVVPTLSVNVLAHQSGDMEGQASVPNPQLWSLEKPARYVVVTSVEENGSILDGYQTPFGIRTIEFTADNGFLLNGKRVPINGVCDHHDLGCLGAAINVSALRRQIRILQEMGCNAIRTSHNPPAPELLDLCDSMGMLVMDESFDCWKRGKTKNDYHLLFDDWHEKDWRAELHRDRNHPSIILWSIGNEISEQSSKAGIVIASELSAIAHEEDPTRPTTAACNNVKSGYNGFGKCLDVFGYNYKPNEYGKFRKANPKQPIFGSETASCISSRGEYFFPVTTNKLGGEGDFQMSSYDLYAPRWATTPDTEFAGQDENPFVAGEFVWTGFDYMGEPTPYNSDLSNMLNFTDPAEQARMEKELEDLGRIPTPSRSSYFGIVDLAGFKKDRFYLYQARWRPTLPMAHILPHWNWPDRVGKVTPVYVYTSGDEAELFLNGKSLGRKTKGRFEYRLHWDDVVYEPGELKVVAYKNGHRWAMDVVKTTGAAAKLLMSADHDKIDADGKDLAYVTVTVADRKNLPDPRAQNHIHFEIEGPGEIVATDNGDATSFESFQAPERNAFNGLALVVVRAKADEPGTIVLKATSDGLRTATLKIRSQ
ncbi:MAG TPA: beta-galactosidase GalB [Verrucomicrobiae bacterium]|nr:beta-galactosidase GalB [Verrucomicrobiae bacterium]